MTTAGYAAITYTCGHTYELPLDWPNRRAAARSIKEEARRAKRLPCDRCIEQRGRPCERCGQSVKAIYASGEPEEPVQHVCRTCLIAQGWTPADAVEGKGEAA
jgi:hypothetical protein